MPKISVIVPVYKAENYLHRCVDSLLAQTFTDFEVLLVDDGSPDRSGEICDEYAQKDDRVRVFHKENGGVSSARNVGIDNALGEYTIHADPDDWVEPNMLEELYKKAQEEDADMVICDFIKHTATKEIMCEQRPTNNTSFDVLNDILVQKLHGACWNKLIKASTYRIRGIRFPENIVIWEDQFFLINIIKEDIKVAHVNKYLYHYDYFINPNSLVRKQNQNKVFESMQFFIDYFSNRLDNRYLNHLKIACKNKAFVIEKFDNGKDFINFYSEINKYYKNNKNGLVSISIAYIIKYPFLFKNIVFLYQLINNIRNISSNN